MGEASILVVDDEPMVREVLSRYLSREGFDVSAAEDGEEALTRYARATPDLVLLDLMLPKIDGYEVFRRIREQGGRTPGIMLTAKGEETDRIVGLELGADDYVAKPFSPREVVARVRAVLRRTDSVAPDPVVMDLGRIAIDTGRREVTVEGRPVRLTRIEFDLLAYLASSPGTTFTRARLLEDVWDFAWDGDTATVTVHVRRIREKIESAPSEPKHLVTVWGVGYRFEP
ncbi:MAG TPA: response regulator transcription factor [Actinomycetota bacterium]|nr:response regulator transcription factor [Actinomycetota bacterium]